MSGQITLQTWVGLAALSVALTAMWLARRQARQEPLLTVFCLAAAAWAAGLLLAGLQAAVPLGLPYEMAAEWIRDTGQVVLVCTVFLLAFRLPGDRQAQPSPLPDLASLALAAGLVVTLFAANPPADGSSIADLLILLAALLASASVLRILFTPRFWERLPALIVLAAAGALAVTTLLALAGGSSWSETATSLVLFFQAAAGLALAWLPAEPHPARTPTAAAGPGGSASGPAAHARGRQRGGAPDADLPDPLGALRQAVDRLPAVLFTSDQPTTSLDPALAGLGQPLKAARVALFRNETNAQDLLCLSLEASWAADGVPTRREDPQLQRLPYALCSLARWESVLANGEPVSLEFDTPQENDTLFSPQVRLVLLLPVRIYRRWLGLLTVEFFDRPADWQAEATPLLQNAASLLGLALAPFAQAVETTSQPDAASAVAEARVQNELLEEQLAERIKLEEEAEKRLLQLQTLNATTNVLLSTLDLETLLGRVLDAVSQAIPAAEKGTLHMIAPETGQLEMRAVLGFSDPRIHKHHARARQGLLDTVITRKEAVLIEDVHRQAGLDENLRIGLEPDTRSVIAAPLIADQSVFGALYLAASRPQAFDRNDLHLVSGFATTATLAIRNAQLHEKVQKMAITDQLTTLYNRRGFVEFGERLFESARRFHHSLAIIALDIDYFKSINDTYGHVAGDLVLQQISEIVLRKIRKVDLVARIGGDEFTILLPETDVFQALQVSERLRRRVESARMVTGKGDAGITISLGVSRMSTQTETLEALMDSADQALYESKQSGRNRVRMYPLETPMPDLLPPEPPAS